MLPSSWIPEATAVFTIIPVLFFYNPLTGSGTFNSSCLLMRAVNPVWRFKVIPSAPGAPDTLLRHLQFGAVSYPVTVYAVAVFPFAYLLEVCFLFLHVVLSSQAVTCRILRYSQQFLLVFVQELEVLRI